MNDKEAGEMKLRSYSIFLPFSLSFPKLLSSGCLGCYEKPSFNPLVNESSKGLNSQGSISSISTSNQTLDLHGSFATANAPAEFVNHGNPLRTSFGLLLWNQIRQRWVGNRRSQNRKQLVQEPKLNTHCLSMVKQFWLCSWNATYENLLGSNKPFPQPIPLSEMIDFLVDVWEQEGLYD
ncbi:hypothetical protein ES332_D10G089600v1 [Gossypium tomentosum]|uniref:Gag1-like clamp domain-containing protein n=1 Tax=Gossypium tomentosum TaxID=34277 RepID=A0A5D2J3C9_GOSTO|nr:hypothetical protein ES332_D10G089600v1 [Gossypium tomentosum]